jgi:DNA-binding transcriptional LysR family regulator
MNTMHIGDLDLTQIRLVAELSRLHQISAASERIGISQSAASHALAKLRKQLGDPLFTRTAKGLEPTPYGERLGIAARESLDVLQAGLASSRPFDPRTTTRRFNFYTSNVGQMVLLPKLVARLKSQAPGATLRVVPIPIENPGEALSSGEVDVAVGFFDNLLTTGFLQSFLFMERYVCIVRAGHPNFRMGMSVEAFTNSEHAIADSTGMAHAIIDQLLARYDVHRQDTVRVPDFHVLPTVIANSDLLAVIPSRLAQALQHQAAIKVLPMPVPMPPWKIHIYWHERYHHDPPIRWFRSLFVELFRSRSARASTRDGGTI